MQITQYIHCFIQQKVKPGDCCIDATMGNGNDTELLCRLVGEQGRVLAFDIQKEALEATKKRLCKCGQEAELILDSHENMGHYVQAGSVDCITFNFGYLPGGDHQIATEPQSSLAAIQSGLELLKKDGLMTLCIYSGQDSGFEEHDAVLAFLKELDPKKYLVIVSQYYNRPNHPPVPVILYKLKE